MVVEGKTYDISNGSSVNINNNNSSFENHLEGSSSSSSSSSLSLLEKYSKLKIEYLVNFKKFLDAQFYGCCSSSVSNNENKNNDEVENEDKTEISSNNRDCLVFDNCFCGMLTSVRRCLNCNNEVVVDGNFYNLSLEITFRPPSRVSLFSFILIFFFFFSQDKINMLMKIKQQQIKEKKAEVEKRKENENENSEKSDEILLENKGTDNENEINEIPHKLEETVNYENEKEKEKEKEDGKEKEKEDGKEKEKEKEKEDGKEKEK
jgi:hypothetical protein